MVEKIAVCFNHEKNWRTVDLPERSEPLPRLCESCALKMIDAFYEKFKDEWHKAKATTVRDNYLKRMESINEHRK